MNFSELRFVMCYSNYMNVSKSYSKIKKQERKEKIIKEEREGRRKEGKRIRKKEIPRYSGDSLQLTNQGIWFCLVINWHLIGME